MNKKGFTLVEILGVIVLLSIIIIIATTSGFGAFNNTKNKISEENLNTIKEAANLLMTEVENCNDSEDEELYKNLINEFADETQKNCIGLKTKARTKDENDECLKITLEYLLDNDYVSGSGSESIHNEYPDFYVNVCIDNEKVDTNVVIGEKNNETTTTTTTTVHENVACKDITYGKNTLAYAILCNAKNVTDEQKNSGYAEYRETPLTLPAVEISGENESTLSVTEDDLGTSYYYRGNVKNNYVNFAGMCWRIVRIEGDGSTKLILEDKNTTCDSSTYNGNWSLGPGNYGYEEISTSSGYTLWKLNYLKPVTNKTSSMVKAFYDFQTTNLASYINKLKSGNWCFGDKAYSRTGTSISTYTYTLLNNISNNNLFEMTFYYDTYTRLTGNNKDGYQPTLKCDGTKLDKFATVTNVSSEAPMYVSAISADEVVYAGGKFSFDYSSYNTNYYLVNEEFKKGCGKNVMKSCAFGTLSPYDFEIVDDGEFVVEVFGGLVHYGVYVPNLAFRPAITLKTGIEISNGDGTQTNPYIVQ